MISVIFYAPFSIFFNFFIDIVIKIVSKWISNRLSNEHYDKLFHLYSVFELENGVRLLVEKNSTPNISVKLPPTLHNDDFERISHIPNITLNQFLNNAIQKMGQDNFWRYSPQTQNCQDFILGLLHSNNIHQSEKFIKQNVDSIFESHKELHVRKALNTLTDLDARIQTIREGGKVKK